MLTFIQLQSSNCWRRSVFGRSDTNGK